MKKKKELHEVVLDALKPHSSDPEELITATARALAILLISTKQFTGNDVKPMAEAMFNNILSQL